MADTTPDQVRSEVRGEVRLVAMTSGQRLRIQRLQAWLLEGDESVNDGAPVVGALLIELDRAFQDGITEEEADATRVAVAAPYNTGQRKLAQSLAAKLRSAFKDS